MSTRFEQRRALWEAAMRCPVATPADFVGPVPAEPEPSVLRVVRDPKLRARLTATSMARVVQMPRGRQTFPAIVRLHPNLDAHEAEGGPARPAPAPRAAAERPRLEEIRALVERVSEVERELVNERAAELDRRIGALRAQIPALDGDALAGAVDALRALIDARADLVVEARRDAFARVGDDETFEPRRFLALLSPEVRSVASRPAPPPRPVPPQRSAVHAAPIVPRPEAPSRAGAKAEDPRRLAHRAMWRSRLEPVLSSEWKSASEIAKTLGEGRKTVLERLGDLVKDGTAQRRIVKVRGKKVSRRNRRTSAILEAQFKR